MSPGQMQLVRTCAPKKWPSPQEWEKWGQSQGHIQLRKPIPPHQTAPQHPLLDLHAQQPKVWSLGTYTIRYVRYVGTQVFL